MREFQAAGINVMQWCSNGSFDKLRWDQLEGPALRKQLIELIEKAKKPMPKGSKGAKRPANVRGGSNLGRRIVTGEAEDKPSKAPKRPKVGKAGGAAKAKSTDSPRRKEIVKLAAKARWEG